MLKQLHDQCHYHHLYLEWRIVRIESKIQMMITAKITLSLFYAFSSQMDRDFCTCNDGYLALKFIGTLVWCVPVIGPWFHLTFKTGWILCLFHERRPWACLKKIGKKRMRNVQQRKQCKLSWDLRWDRMDPMRYLKKDSVDLKY